MCQRSQRLTAEAKRATLATATAVPPVDWLLFGRRRPNKVRRRRRRGSCGTFCDRLVRQFIHFPPAPPFALSGRRVGVPAAALPLWTSVHSPARGRTIIHTGESLPTSRMSLNFGEAGKEAMNTRARYLSQVVCRSQYTTTKLGAQPCVWTKRIGNTLMMRLYFHDQIPYTHLLLRSEPLIPEAKLRLASPPSVIKLRHRGDPSR